VCFNKLGISGADLRVAGLIWLEDIVDKLLAKHGVSKEEVEEVFLDLPAFRFVEKGHWSKENVYAALGQTGAGRYLVAFFILKTGGQALILSARNMTETERKRYEKK